jgi:hypothetical protein
MAVGDLAFMRIFSVLLLCVVPIAGMAQPSDAFGLKSKLRFHLESVASPWSLVRSAAYAGLLQEIGTPEEWGRSVGAYGRRFWSTVACSGIHAVLAFGLDSTLHHDPRYFRSRSRGFWRRTAHPFRGTILTRTDRGGETLSTWRFGTAYGASFLSNQWYPDRLNTARLDLVQGSLQVGFDLARDLGAEFLPDLERKILRRKPALAPNDFRQGRP